jgi:HSP20 family protein
MTMNGLTLRRDVSLPRLFDAFFGAQPTSVDRWFDLEPRLAFRPSFEVKESDTAYVVRADLPGVKDKDMSVTMTGNVLTIEGHRESERREENKGENSEQYHLMERSYGSFSRSFTLPENGDPERISADLKEGVLTLTIPKKPEVQPKKITIGGK